MIQILLEQTILIQYYYFAANKKERSKLFKEFCESTSLHGWFFYQDCQKEKKNSLASFYWLFVILASMTGAVFVMGTTVQGNFYS
jgi:hypothetical protein